MKGKGIMARSNRNTSKRKKRRNPVFIFFKIVLSIVLAFVIVAGGAVFAYTKITGKSLSQSQEGTSEKNNGVVTGDSSFLDTIFGKSIQLNVAVLGTDKDGTRTDVIFVVHYDSKEKKVGLLSVPRDTRVTLSQEVKAVLDKAGRSYSNVTKINAVHAYGGKDHGEEVAVLQLEDLLGIRIDHYVKVDLDGFKQLVDAVGGVDVEVPQDMHYEDPYQDLYIHLNAGYQHLDGEKAEQLVRFRSYPQGDVARVQVQQLFLKEFAKKVLSTDTLFGNLTDLIKIAFNYVKTDVSLTDALKYVKYVKDISLENITMETLPGAGQYVGGVSYYIHDPAETQDVVDRLFYGKEEPPTEAGESKDKIIEVANGGVVTGLAGRTQEELNAIGYQVTQISTWEGEKQEFTRIIVAKKGVGEDLKAFFTGSSVEVAPELLSEGTDIKIILGTREK